jgi:hypothetical protein
MVGESSVVRSNSGGTSAETGTVANSTATHQGTGPVCVIPLEHTPAAEVRVSVPGPPAHKKKRRIQAVTEGELGTVAFAAEAPPQPLRPKTKKSNKISTKSRCAASAAVASGVYDLYYDDGVMGSVSHSLLMKCWQHVV